MAPRVEALPAAGLPRHRAIVALDIEGSTSRPDPVKAELRSKLYELFDAALRAAGIGPRHRDRFTDRGDGILSLIHPVDQAPKAILLTTAIPALSQLLTDYNASLPRASRPQRNLRVRVVVHAGEVHYDANGCFGEALDIAFRLLDAAHVKKALLARPDPVILVISGDIHRAVVRHGYRAVPPETGYAEPSSAISTFMAAHWHGSRRRTLVSRATWSPGTHGSAPAGSGESSNDTISARLGIGVVYCRSSAVSR
jgi:class 3 adenylate cyclase